MAELTVSEAIRMGWQCLESEAEAYHNLDDLRVIEAIAILKTIEQEVKN